MTDNNQKADKQTTKTPTVRPDEKVGWSLRQSIWVGLGVFFIPQFLLIIPILLVMQIGGYESVEATFDAFDDWIINSLAAIFVTLTGSGLLYWFLKDRGGWKALGFRRTSIDDMITVLPVFFAYFLTVIAAFALVSFVAPDINLDEQQDVGFESGQSGIAMLAAFVTLVILAPVYEEVLFRGFTFRGVAQRLGFWPAALITSGLFGLAHMQLNVGIDTFILGMFASWLVWHTKSIWPAIALHGLKNLLAYLFLFVF